MPGPSQHAFFTTIRPFSTPKVRMATSDRNSDASESASTNAKGPQNQRLCGQSDSTIFTAKLFLRLPLALFEQDAADRQTCHQCVERGKV